MKAIERTVDQERGSIRQVLERQRVEQARAELLDRLRERYVTQLNEAPLDALRFDGDGVIARETPAWRGHAAPAGSSIPEPRERETR